MRFVNLMENFYPTKTLCSVYYKINEGDKYKYLGKFKLRKAGGNFLVLVKRENGIFKKDTRRKYNAGVLPTLKIRIDRVEYDVALMDIKRDYSGKGVYSLCYIFRGA